MSSPGLSTSLGLLILRATTGFTMLKFHGLQKLENFEKAAQSFPDPLGIGSPETSLMLAIGAEVGCAGLLIAGLATRLSALPLAMTMGIAVFMIHGEDPWAKKELALLYLVAYVAVFFAGPGKFSLDHLFFGGKSSSEAAE